MTLGGSALIGFVATARPEAARRFYRDILGLKLIEDFEFALVFDSNGTMLRIAKVERVIPSGNTVLGWGVRDIDEAIADLTGKGVVFEYFAGLNDPETGIWTTVHGDHVAWFKDPDGNLLSLTQLATVPRP